MIEKNGMKSDNARSNSVVDSDIGQLCKGNSKSNASTFNVRIIYPFYR